MLLARQLFMVCRREPSLPAAASLNGAYDFGRALLLSEPISSTLLKANADQETTPSLSV